MKECAERVVELGFKRGPKVVFDEVERITAEMVRAGWTPAESLIEESLGYIHLFFERELSQTG